MMIYVHSVGVSALLRWSTAIQADKALSERALSLSLIDKGDIGSGSKHYYSVYFP
jgi:hypothetical protein